MSEEGEEEVTEENLELEELSADVDSSELAVADDDDIDDQGTRAAADLQAVFEVPVAVSAILGKTKMDVSDLLKLEKGSVVELDRKVGEAVDIYINNRLIARGEVVGVEAQLGITMTEIIKDEG